MNQVTPRTHQTYKRATLAALAFLTAALAFPETTSAHVKWFASYDVTTPPKPFADVATPMFFTVFAVFTGLLLLAFLADGWVTRRWPRLESAGSANVFFQDKWVRLGTGAFLLCTWSIRLNILTPELHTKRHGSSPFNSSVPFA